MVLRADSAMKMSFLRWAGSKKKILKSLLPYWQCSGYKRYVEPFAGSAMLFFAVHPGQAILADTNEDLIEMYRTMQRNWRGVFREISKLPCTERFYYQLRNTHFPRSYVLRRAARFIYLNRFCFNGLYRTNRNGNFNVPYARGTTRKIQSRDEFEQFANDVRNAQFVCQDFRETLQQVRQGDFVYIDPPYAVENKRVFKQYGPTPFCEQDLEELSKMLTDINRRGATFVISYAYNKESLAVSRRWFRKSLMVQRSVAGTIAARKVARELIISNVEL